MSAYTGLGFRGLGFRIQGLVEAMPAVSVCYGP